MTTLITWVVGLVALAVAAFWLVVLPFRLAKGLLHKWDYHAYCGLSCTHNATEQAIRAALNNHFSKGLRDGMRWTVQNGVEQSAQMLRMHTLPPLLDPADAPDDRSKRVVARVNQVAQLTDVQDDATEWANALTLSLSSVIRRTPDPEAALGAAHLALDQFVRLQG